MKIGILQQYVFARKALLHEKSQLEGRLQQINQALDQAPSAVTVTSKPVARISRGRGSPISMRAAVVQVTTDNPMTKPEIMAAIQKLGFQSASKKPLQLLDNLLYGRNPKFRNDNGRFSPMGTATRAAGTKPATEGARPSRKRKVSAAGRAKLAALMKARWAKIKKTGGRKLKAV